jgi:hypothetical protein
VFSCNKRPETKADSVPVPANPVAAAPEPANPVVSTPEPSEKAAPPEGWFGLTADDVNKDAQTNTESNEETLSETNKNKDDKANQAADSKDKKHSPAKGSGLDDSKSKASPAKKAESGMDDSAKTKFLGLFKKSVDEFSGDITYYPSIYNSKGEWLDVQPSSFVITDKHGSDFGIAFHFISADWIFAKNIYIILDNKRYDIPYKHSDISTDVFSGGSCFEVYTLTSFQVSSSMQNDILSSKNIKVRIGELTEVDITSQAFQDMKNAIILYKYRG